MRQLLLLGVFMMAQAAFADPSTPTYLKGQSDADVEKSSAGCMSCHTTTDNRSMHGNPAVKLGCADCHGGDPSKMLRGGVAQRTPEYRKILDSAHVKPRYPAEW